MKRQLELEVTMHCSLHEGNAKKGKENKLSAGLWEEAVRMASVREVCMGAHSLG